MSWTSFAALTAATTVQLDANFSILSGLTPIPCTVAGTNTLTLTSVAGAATIAAYANYMRFTGIAAQSNTGPVTAQFGSLAALNVYKDTIAGPVVLIGGEIVQNNEITLIYDLALNSGSGGFHLKTGVTELVGQTIIAENLSVSPSTTLSRLRQANVTTSFGVVAVGAAASVSISPVNLSGAQVGDFVAVGFPVTPQLGIGYVGYLSATGTVVLRAFNYTAASIAAFTATLTVEARGYI